MLIGSARGVTVTTSISAPGTDAVLPLSGVGGTDGVPDSTVIPGLGSTGVLQVFPRDATITSIALQITTLTSGVEPVGGYLDVTAVLYTQSAGAVFATPTGVSCTARLSGAIIPSGTTVACLNSGYAWPVTAGMTGVIVLRGSQPIPEVQSVALSATTAVAAA